MDRTDLKILASLQENSGLPNIELAEKVGLSPSPCLRRVRALEERGLIQGYKAVVDRQAVGLNVRAFVEVRLERQSGDVTGKFLNKIGRMPEVMSCYLMTGALDFLLDVVTTDLDAYAEFTTDRLIALPGVKEVRSSFVLKEFSNHKALPLSHVTKKSALIT